MFLEIYIDYLIEWRVHGGGSQLQNEANDERQANRPSFAAKLIYPQRTMNGMSGRQESPRRNP